MKLLPVADPKMFERKGGWAEDNFQPRPHLSQMHTTIYKHFTRNKVAFLRKIEPIGDGAAAPTAPPIESATDLCN